MLHRKPRTVLSAAGYTLLDEVHPFHSIVDIRIDSVNSFDGLALSDIDHRIVGGGINVRKSFEERFGVSAWQTACCSAAGVHERSVGVASVKSMGLAVLTNDPDIRLLLTP